MTPLSFGTWNFGLCTFAGRVARPASITSVTRWLLVVVGCAVLAMAQPMSAAPVEETPPAAGTEEKSGAKTPAEKPASPDQIVYPRNSPDRPDLAPVSDSSAASNTLMLLAAIALAAAGGWVLFQRRQSGLLAVRGQRKLQIEETRPLGNRQYLVVANYDGKKFLLGITTNKINLLTPLDDSVAPPSAPPEVKP